MTERCILMANFMYDKDRATPDFLIDEMVIFCYFFFLLIFNFVYETTFFLVDWRYCARTVGYWGNCVS